MEILSYIPPNLTNAIIALIALFIIYKILTNLLKKILAKTPYAEESKSFLNIWRYFFVVIVVIFTIAGSSGSLATIGMSAGLMGAALGWALQKPITGIAAWLMIVTKRPFRIGDRIIIGDMKGDVSDITLTHIHLKEFGGTIGGEERSGREVMIPTSILFDKNITNYTSENKYILDEVTVAITYESNLKKAKQLVEQAASEILKDAVEKSEFKPEARVKFQASGIDVSVRYKVLAPKRQKTASEVSEKLYELITAAEDIEFAYPHNEVILKDKRKLE
jgi:small-conductance mechanosensitive channel